MLTLQVIACIGIITGESGSIFRIGGDVSSNAADCRFGTAF